MKRFIAQLNDCSFINIQADRFVLQDQTLLVYNDNNLVAFLDISVVLTAHLSEKQS